MKRHLATLIAGLSLGGPMLSASCSPDSAPAPFYMKNTAWESRNANFGLQPAFERERGVSWDGQIGWKTQERVWPFAAALESSLKGIIRADSPYRLSVAVVRVERPKGTFVVEFTIHDATGESVEQVQVEGTGPHGPSRDDLYPVVAGKIVTAFEKSVLK
jgi:hypothetical protein